MLQINHDGSVLWTIPQQVHINLVPRMDLDHFPFDKQVVRFTLGPWINRVSNQNTTFMGGASDPCNSENSASCEPQICRIWGCRGGIICVTRTKVCAPFLGSRLFLFNHVRVFVSSRPLERSLAPFLGGSSDETVQFQRSSSPAKVAVLALFSLE
jgi:hypothetical protein